MQILPLAALAFVGWCPRSTRSASVVNPRRGARPAIAAVAILGMVVGSSRCGLRRASSCVGARELLASIFEQPPPVDPSNGYCNFLLLGADSRLRRDSMRFSS
ncbi:MAG: hypothetical protein R2692_00875 [Microbacterium sp.]